MASMLACGETNPCPRLLGKDSLITDRWNFRIPGDVSGTYAGILRIVIGIGVRAGKQVHIGFWASFLLGVGHQPPHGHSLPFSTLVGITQAPGRPFLPLHKTGMVFVCELMGILYPLCT